MIYLLDRFDISMVNFFITIRPISVEDARRILRLHKHTSCVTDEHTAFCMGEDLGIPVSVVQKEEEIILNQIDGYIVYQKGRWWLIEYDLF